MKCINPYKPLGSYSVSVLLPCGQCMACRVNRARDWAVRIMHETDEYDYSSFVTLTYDDDNVPYYFGYGDEWVQTLCKRDLQKFFKRLRSYYSKQKIKYYACGEYGERTHRPHYHAIIFGLKPNDELCDFLQFKVWKKGMVHVGFVTYDSARYVASYVQKKWYGSDWSNKYEGREREFQLSSQGFGKRFVEKNKEQILNNRNITIYGKDVGIPRYYRKLLDLNCEEFYEEQEEQVNNIHNIHGDPNFKDIDFNRMIFDKEYSESVRKAQREEFDSLMASRKAFGRKLNSQLNLREKKL